MPQSFEEKHFDSIVVVDSVVAGVDELHSVVPGPPDAEMPDKVELSVVPGPDIPDGAEIPDGGVMPDGGETPDGGEMSDGDVISRVVDISEVGAISVIGDPSEVDEISDVGVGPTVPGSVWRSSA